MFWTFKNVSFFSLVNILFIASYVFLFLRCDVKIRYLIAYLFGVIIVFITVFKSFFERLYSEGLNSFSIQIIILFLISIISPIVKTINPNTQKAD